MKSSSKFALLTILVGALCISGCSNLQPSNAPSEKPATVAYTLGGPAFNGILEYSTVPTKNTSSSIGSLEFPPSFAGGTVATDSIGQIYAGGNAGQAEQILVYPPSTTGASTPFRTINTGHADALAVDAAGLLYVADSGQDSVPPSVTVYSAAANGSAAPLRTFEMTGFALSDIAVDNVGNVYASGIGSSTANLIAVYPPTASGSATPVRTIVVNGDFVGGVAVDRAGDVYVMVMGVSSDVLNTAAIEEFAPDADGAATPINTINLSLQSATGIVNGSVHLDAAGNIFASLELFTQNADLSQTPSFVIYGFEPTATGKAEPTVQITPPNTYGSPFALN
jgi:hypothetical protein